MGVFQCAVPLAGPVLSDAGGVDRHHPFQKCDHHGPQQYGVCIRGMNCERSLQPHPPMLSNQLSEAFSFLKCFLSLLRGHHVLVKTDNTTTVAYINRQVDFAVDSALADYTVWHVDRFSGAAIGSSL